MNFDSESAHLGMVQSARDTVIVAIKSGEDIAQSTADSLATLFAEAEKAPGIHGDFGADAVTRGAVRGACEMGVDLRSVAQGILRGAIEADPQSNGTILDVITQTSRSTVHAVAGMEADLSATVRGLLDAALDNAAAHGSDPSDAQSAAGIGALLGAAQFSGKTQDTIRRALDRATEPEMAAMPV